MNPKESNKCCVACDGLLFEQGECQNIECKCHQPQTSQLKHVKKHHIDGIHDDYIKALKENPPQTSQVEKDTAGFPANFVGGPQALNEGHTQRKEQPERDYLSRFEEVANGLKLDRSTADKIANFVHYEIQTVISQTIEKQEDRMIGFLQNRAHRLQPSVSLSDLLREYIDRKSSL